MWRAVEGPRHLLCAIMPCMADGWMGGRRVRRAFVSLEPGEHREPHEQAAWQSQDGQMRVRRATESKETGNADQALLPWRWHQNQPQRAGNGIGGLPTRNEGSGRMVQAMCQSQELIKK
jgi:hypothetical protein